MLELLKSLVFAVIMVPVVMAVILGLFTVLAKCSTSSPNIGHQRSQPAKSLISSDARSNPGALLNLFLSCRYLYNVP